MVALYHQNQHGYNVLNGQQVWNGVERGLISRNLWGYLIEEGVLRSEIDVHPPRISLNIYNQKRPRIDEQKPMISCLNGKS